MTPIDVSSEFSARTEYFSSSQGLLGWLYQSHSRNKAFVTKGFFLRKTDRQFFLSCRDMLAGYFPQETIDWLSHVHNGNTRLGFLLLHMRKSGSEFIEGATFSLQTVSPLLPKARDCMELIIEPFGTSCRIGIHIAAFQLDETVKHTTITTVIENGETLANLLDSFVANATLDIDRQWENWSHWWLKEAQSLPIDVPTRFAPVMKISS